MNRTPSKLKQAVFFAIMVFLMVVFTVGVLELGLAAYYSDKESTGLTRFHPVRGWTLVPGQYWIKPRQKFISFPVLINDFGLRSQERAVAPQHGPRLVVLGDSFTFARETQTERTFAAQLQQLLSNRLPGIEVLNAGVPGYGTAQELLLMRELHEAHHIDPQVYVLMFFTNDILDNLCLSYGNLTAQPVRPCFTLGEGGQLTMRTPEEKIDGEDDTLGSQGRGGLKTIATARALVEEWLQAKPSVVKVLNGLGIRVQVARMPAILNGWYRDDIVAKGAPLTGALLRQIRDEASSRGARLIVSMVPSPFEVYPDTYVPLLRKSFPGDPTVERFAADMSRSQRVIKELCDTAGIPFQDLLPVFSQNKDKTLFVPRDGHLNDAGHDLVSRTLFDFVVSQWPGMEK